MTNLIFIAPPAAGKGTQSELLEQNYNYAHISTGDMLREVAASGTELGNQVAELINNGIFVSDEMIFEMLKNKLQTLQSHPGIIFDGFPRTLKQVEMLDELLKSMNQKVDYVIYLDIDRDMAMHRALGRISCPKCNAIYNLYNDVFNKEGYCNKCGAELEKRGDDNEATFINRFNTYIEKSQPIIDYYKQKGLLNVVKCCEEKEDTFKQIEDVINGCK